MVKNISWKTFLYYMSDELKEKLLETLKEK